MEHHARRPPRSRRTDLRAASLDELPQRWNILEGEPSLVGPRPERPHLVDQLSGPVRRYAPRHRVAAGLARDWSTRLDTTIVLTTVSQVLRRQGG